MVESKCTNGHRQIRKCFQSKTSTCQQCDLEEDRRQKELETNSRIQQERDKVLAKHATNMAELERQIQLARAEATGAQLADEQSKALQQKKRDLETAKRLLQTEKVKQRDEIHKVDENRAWTEIDASRSDRGEAKMPNTEMEANPETQSPSEKEWERQKCVDNASNDAIDVLVRLTGLEQVKWKILDIKAKMETLSRQGVDPKKERLGMVMLGNPGTGENGL